MTKMNPLLLTNLHAKARAYCDAVDAVLELGTNLDDAQVRRVLAILQDAESTARELRDRLQQLCVDSGWLERVSESRRTDKRERLPTNTEADPAHAATVQQAVLRPVTACSTCGTTDEPPRGFYMSGDGRPSCVACWNAIDTQAVRR